MDLTITKTGRIDFDRPVILKSMSLRNITLYQTMYNITDISRYGNSATGAKATFNPGYYTYDQIKAKIPNDFNFDVNTLKVELNGIIIGSLKDLINKDNILYLTPLSLYMFCDEIDSSKNYLDGKRSNLLAIVPIGKTNVGEIFKHQNMGDSYKSMNANEYNGLQISIKDENGHPYNGKFVAELSLI